MEPQSLAEPDPAPSQDQPTAVPSWARVLRVLILMATDVAVLCGTLLLAVWFWAIGRLGQDLLIYVELWPLLGLFLLGLALIGLYPGFGLGPVEVLRRLTLQTSFIYIVLAASSFAIKLPPRYSRATFFLAWAGAVLLLPVVRSLVTSLARRVVWWWEEPAIVLGPEAKLPRILNSLAGEHSLGYRPVCAVRLGESADRDSPLPVPVLSGLDAVDGLARRGFRVVLVVLDPEDAEPLIEWLQVRFRHVILIPAGERTPIEGVEVRNLGSAVGLEFHNQLLRPGNRVLKRALDLVLGSILLVAALPAIALAAVAVRLASRGPVLFHQEREGLDGQPIKVWKIRTMRHNAAKHLEDHLEKNPEARKEWESQLKLRTDPRIIPGIGAFLRRYSIDELPQLWSVIRGTMSLVGPRPFPEYHLERLPPEFRELRRKVRPGITGLWQVVVRSAGDLLDQERLDTYYIRNWSLWLDLYILGRTGLAVLASRGAY